MSAIPKSKSTPAQMIAHRHMQRTFTQHRGRFDKYRAKGPLFAAAIDDLEKRLFGDDATGNQGDPNSKATESEG